MKKERKLAEEIIAKLGGKDNIENLIHCMTRLRITVKNKRNIAFQSLQEVDGVMGVVDDNPLQIVIGPGTVNKVATEMERLIEKESQQDQETKDTKLKQLLGKLGTIFIPLIPAFVATGMINGLVQLLQLAGYGEGENWFLILVLCGQVLFSAIGIIVGWSAAKVWNGTPVIGAIIGGILFSPMLAEITLYSQKLIPGGSGLLGVIVAVYLGAIIEKWCRTFIPNSVDLMLTPFVTIIIVGFVSLLLIMPAASIVSKSITTGVALTLDYCPIFTGALLSAFYMPLVLAGLHHGFTLLHVELLHVFGETGLLPILAMSGAGQVGAALAVYVKTSDSQLKSVIRKTVPVGFLGIGEPLLYGVTLPLGRPFITGSVGAAFGGAFLAWSGIVANGIGLSGLPLLVLIGDGKYLLYLVGIVIAYIASFICTYAFGLKRK